MQSPFVMLIEDSPDDAEFARRVFAKRQIAYPLCWIEEGEAALQSLHNAECLPALILLDLNLAGLEGREVLRRIKQDPDLRMTPVVILTTSAEPADVLACYRAGANSYHQKPADFHRFENMLQQITDYWLETTVPPRITIAERGNRQHDVFEGRATHVHNAN